MIALRSALRALRATPLVSTIAILSLALGIGANTAIFSIVDALILRSLPVEHAARLVLISDGDRRTSWTNPIWEQVRERAALFDGAFAVGRVSFNLSTGGVTDPVDGLYVSAHYFDVLGAPPALGRTFVEDDDRRGGGPDGPVAVISHAFWQGRFGGDPAIVGKPLTMSGTTFTIVGVMSPSFFGHEVGRGFDVAVPLGTEPLVRGAESTLDRRSTWWLNVFARLRPDQTAEQATALLRTVQPQIREATLPPNWEADALERYLGTPLTAGAATSGTSALRERYEQPLLALTVVVAFTLLIACGNIANLMLARATARRHEFAMRTALGASRWRLVRQLLGENLLLSGAGAVLGVVIALWASRVILSQIGTSTRQVILNVGLDWRMLGFTALIAVGTTLLFGVAPAMFASRVAPMEALKQHGSGRGGSGRRVGVAGSLVLAQVALSLMLLVASGLFMRTFASLASVELGFTPEQLVVVNVGSQRSPVDPAHRSELYARVRDAALTVPSVRAAGLAVVVPVSGNTWNSRLDFPGQPDIPREARVVNMNYLSSDWFTTMGTQLIAGRDFDRRDQMGGNRTAIVNRAFAERFFGGESPIGKTVVDPGFGDEPSVPLEIVGLVADAVYAELREPLSPTLYRPLAQEAEPGSTVRLTVRVATNDVAAVTRSLTEAIRAVDRDLTLSYRPMTDYLDAALSQERLIAMMAGFFGALALLLAALGLYGITAYAVSRRQIELGIRMALGATPASVMQLVLTRTGALVIGGILLGGIGSWWASRFVSALLFGLTPTDPLTVGGAMLLLAAVAFVAGWIPARRAARIDPAVVMREG